jgi:hypothetical protein
MAQAQLITRATHGDSLADILERVLNTGLVIAGDIRIKLCDVELLSIQLRLLICSVEKARELGISWWWQSPQQQAPLPASPEKPAEMPLAAKTPGLFAAGEQRQPSWQSRHFQQAMSALEHGPRR